MTLKEYQKEAVKFRTETANNEEYLTLGLIEEVGEAAGKLAKRRRDGVWDEKAFIKELGDILWFIVNLADFYGDVDDALEGWDTPASGEYKQDYNDMRYLAYRAVGCAADDSGPDDFDAAISWILGIAKSFGYTLEQVAEINLAKLRDREARGQIHGNGDER